MKTIAEEWAEYQACVIPEDVGPELRGKMREAFYAGQLLMLVSITDMYPRIVTHLSPLIDELSRYTMTMPPCGDPACRECHPPDPRRN